MRYNPDQPRQDDGKFGSGGGDDNKDKKKDKKDLHKKPKGAKLTKTQFAQAASDAMSDFTSKSPKGFAQDGDNKYGYIMDDDYVSTFDWKTKKGGVEKWKKTKN
jgi:hypothetical protein